MRWTGVPWKNLTLTLVLVLAGLGVSELLVRAFIPIRNVGPSFTTYDPVYGRSLKKNFSARRITPEFTMDFTTNSAGFRGPELETSSSRPILFLGDSFTMGYGVNDGEEFPALVRKALRGGEAPAVSVINAGMGENGNGRAVKFLRAEGKKYSPGLVAVQIHGNDYQDNIRERLFEVDSTGDLVELPVPSSIVTRMIQSFIEGVPGLAYSHLVGLTRQVSWPGRSPFGQPGGGQPDGHSGQKAVEDQLLLRLVDEIVDICADNGWQLLVLLVDMPDGRREQAEEFLAARGVATMVIAPERTRPDLYYETDGHWNAAGQRFAADRVLEALGEPGTRE